MICNLGDPMSLRHPVRHDSFTSASALLDIKAAHICTRPTGYMYIWRFNTCMSHTWILICLLHVYVIWVHGAWIHICPLHMCAVLRVCEDTYVWDTYLCVYVIWERDVTEECMYVCIMYAYVCVYVMWVCDAEEDTYVWDTYLCVYATHIYACMRHISMRVWVHDA